MGINKSDQAGQLFTQTCTNRTRSWLVCNCSTFGAHMNHGHTLEEKLSFATYLMQLKNLACNYFGVACNMCSYMRHFLVA